MLSSAFALSNKINHTNIFFFQRNNVSPNVKYQNEERQLLLK